MYVLVEKCVKIMIQQAPLKIYLLPKTFFKEPERKLETLCVDHGWEFTYSRYPSSLKEVKRTLRHSC